MPDRPTPKVTVCIPTYNRAHLLPYAVNSVLAQTFGDFELIICDDASTDSTPQVVAQWDDPRIRYLRHSQNIKRSRNMRSGYEAARGDYFVKFDDDDALTPEFLRKTVAVLETEPTVDFVCTDHWIINGLGQRDEAATVANSAKWGKDRLGLGVIPDLVWETFEQQSLQVGSTLFRRTSLAAVDFMRFEADGCEDFDLLVRLAIAGQCGYFIPERLMEYRFHGGQTSLRQDIHFLSAKVFCLESYTLPTPALAASRDRKLKDLRQVLALRLLEQGEGGRGRHLLSQLLRQGHRSRRLLAGWCLSYVPLPLRRWLFRGFRHLRPKDYSERVRAVGG